MTKDTAMLKTLAPRRKIKQIGPDDDGRRMSLAEFDLADGQEGYLYELNKGIIEVTNIPHRSHFAQQSALVEQLMVYKSQNPEAVHAVGTPDSTKVLIEIEQSERHPDVAVYTTPMPDVDEIWSIWVPTIAVEVVSKSSAKRDYEDKPGEYLAFGISEYWIVDEFKKQMTVLSRYRGIWKDRIIKPSQKYTTRHLPGFSLDLKRVFAFSK
jgi:Uma2 family endonuclease